MNKTFFLIFLIFIVTVTVVFLKQASNTGFRSIDGVVFEFARNEFVLVNLSECKNLQDFYTDQGSPRRNYTLESDTIDLSSYLYKPIKVWGKVEETTRILKPPEIVCIKSPCELKITEKTMYIEKIEIDNKQLSPCQTEYLNDLSSRPRK